MFIGGRRRQLPTHSGHWCGRRGYPWVRLYTGLLAVPSSPSINLYQGMVRNTVLRG